MAGQLRTMAVEMTSAAEPARREGSLQVGASEGHAFKVSQRARAALVSLAIGGVLCGAVGAFCSIELRATSPTTDGGDDRQAFLRTAPLLTPAVRPAAVRPQAVPLQAARPSAATTGLLLNRPAAPPVAALGSGASLPATVGLGPSSSSGSSSTALQARGGAAPVGVGTADFTGRAVSTKAEGPLAEDSSILVQGGSLRTWSYSSPAVEKVQVVLSTEGRPLDADIELWHGPDNTPCKMRVYVENGQLRPFSAVVETPRGPNTVAIRNIGQIEFPIAANVIADDVDTPSNDCLSSSSTIQGGALRTYPFDPSVDSVQVLLKTDGRPLNARIELLQGPNNNKQVIELYTEDGFDRPFFAILNTPGSGNVVRVVNTAPVEFPMTAAVVPHSINEDMHSGAILGGDVVIGGDVGRTA